MAVVVIWVKERQNGQRSITGGKQTRYSGDSRTKATLLSLIVKISLHWVIVKCRNRYTLKSPYKEKHYIQRKFDKSGRICKEVGGCKCTQASQKLSDLI